MILHTDIPTRAHIDRLLQSRDPASVSIYVPTDPASSNAGPRTGLRNMGERALQQLRSAGVESARIAAVEDELADLVDDHAFWRYQARTLAVLLTPDLLQTFRLPNRLLSIFEVSDRFYLKPLLRAVTFPQVAFVLALAQNSVRVIEVSADDEPADVTIPDLPSDAASVAGRSSLADRAPTRRIQGDEGRKVRLRQYARHIDLSLRPFLSGHEVPLILAATEPLDAIFRSVCTYPHLAPESIHGNPEGISDADLGARAREILDGLYAAELRRIQRLFDERRAQDRGLGDLGDVARAATYGAVDTVLVDIDDVVPGTVDEQTGAVTLAEEQSAERYGVVDEIARRVWLADGKVLAVRREDVPGTTGVAAILRYPI